MTPAKSSFEIELEKIHASLSNDSNTWMRPDAPEIKDGDELTFQQLDVEYFQDPHTKLPVMRLFGVSAEQHSVICNVIGFLPYFYIPCPKSIITCLGDLEAFQDKKKNEIDDKCWKSFILTSEKSSVLEEFRFELERLSNNPIPGCSLIYRNNIMRYSPNKGGLPFLKITVQSQTSLNNVKNILERGFNWRPQIPEYISYSSSFESNIPLVLRFMIDSGMSGMSWVTLPPKSFKSILKGKQSSCQYEVQVDFTKLICHRPDIPRWSVIAPLRLLSFDIECSGRKGIFPEPSHDPVIQIASILQIQGESGTRIRMIHCLNTCSPIIGAHISSHSTEEEMLESWSKDFRDLFDPDVVIGYNINGFDFGYLLDRANKLNIKSFPFLGRLKETPTKATDTFFSSKAYGARESKSYNLDGRLTFDLLQVMQRDYKLRSYSLNSVSAHFLNEQKEDVPHNIISDLQSGNEETRRRLAVYCLKDAHLPLRLINKLMCIFNYSEMSRVTGIPFNYILSRGQQVKVISQLYRKSMEEGYLIPALKVEQSSSGSNEVEYEGATVIDPIKGYYDLPIATLDFASLYPSIMMAHNLCYTTLVDPSSFEDMKLKEGDYIKTPSNDIFVTKNVRRGILPVILEDLLSARKRAKADMKGEQDPMKRAVLDGRQSALKMSANSVYGFTGATVGKLPCIPISQSVTAFGRQMIEKTKEMVEDIYSKKNNRPYDAQVIYGDTDSVMIKFGPSDLAEAMKLGKEAALLISEGFEKPISLEFEKCYFPYLLINKKRYAGLYWTKVDHYDKMDTKGIETVRRDNCRLVQTVIDTSLRKILIDRDIDGAKDYVKQVIADLLQNRIDLSQLVITKALSKAGEDYHGKQAHVELAERMRKRDAATAPNMGDRVAYVIITGHKGAAAYEKAEDPIYVLEHSLPIDTRHYLENHLSKPLMRVFEPILTNPNELLSGDHTRCVSVTSGTSGVMSKFVVKVESCLGCKATLRKGQSIVCDHCKPRMSEIYLRHVNSLNSLEDRYSRLWTQCQRCQGSMHQEVLCTSRDCPIFYMRKKVQKDMNDVSIIEEKFKSVEW